MSPALPREERDAIRARVEAATEGPWETEGPWSLGHTVVGPRGYLIDAAPGGVPCMTEADAEFIAHARTDVPALLDALDAAEAEVARMNDDIWQAAAMQRETEADRDAARAEVAALRGRIEALAAMYEARTRDTGTRLAPDAVADRLRALAADEGERTGR